MGAIRRTGRASPNRCWTTRAIRSSIPAPPIKSCRCCRASSSAVPAARSRSIGKPLAGKTGTSNESKDVWFVGFSPDLACGVFVGFDNPRTLGKLEQGATVAAPIFRDFMKGALADVPATPFRVPPGIEFVSVDRITGALAAVGSPTAIDEAFKVGTAPGDPGAPPQLVVGGDEPAGTNPANPSDVGEGTGGLY